MNDVKGGSGWPLFGPFLYVVHQPPFLPSFLVGKASIISSTTLLTCLGMSCSAISGQSGNSPVMPVMLLAEPATVELVAGQADGVEPG